METQLLNTSGALANLIFVISVILLVPSPFSGLRYILLFSIIIQIIKTSILLVALTRWTRIWAELHHVRLRDIVRICSTGYRKYFRRYTVPLQLTAVFSYAKEYLGVLFLGQFGLMAQAGLFDIIRKIYLVPRKLIPGLINILMPKLVLALETNSRERFRQLFNRFTWLQLGFNVIVGSLLLVLSPVVLKIGGIEQAPDALWLVFLFSANLIFLSIGHCNNYILQFGKDTRPLFPISAARSVIVTALTVVLVPTLESIGAGLALVFSNGVTAVLFAYVTRGTKLWTWENNIYQAAAGSAVVLLWAAAVATVS
jgi:O-antigen/teichoic acid export membrane protein